VTFEDPDGFRRAWEWCKDVRTLNFRVQKAGRYKLRYFIEGGFLSVGTMVESLDVHVKNPIKSFTVDTSVAAGSPICIRWELEFVPPGCMLVFRQGRVRLADRPVSSAMGNTEIPAPRAPGQFSVTIQGTNSRESQMQERQVEVLRSSVKYELFLHRETGDIQRAIEHGESAIVVAPGSKVDVAWKGDLAEGSDSILLCWGQTGNTGHVLARLTCSSGPAASRDRQGMVTVTAPSRVGFTSVIYGVRYNHVTIPAAMAHIAISDKLAPASEQQPLSLAAVDGATATELEDSPDQYGAGADTPGLVDVLSMLVASVPTAEPGWDRESLRPGQSKKRPSTSQDCARGGADNTPGNTFSQATNDEAGSSEVASGCDVDENDDVFAAAIPAIVRGHWSGAAVQEADTGQSPAHEVLCVVCLDSAVNTLIRPCNHVILCTGCSASLKVCPLDRRKIEMRERIYMC